MKTVTGRAATVVAAGVLGLGGLAVAVPALADAGPSGQQYQHDQQQHLSCHQRVRDDT